MAGGSDLGARRKPGCGRVRGQVWFYGASDQGGQGRWGPTSTPRTPIAPRIELNDADFFAGAWASLMPVGGWPTDPKLHPLSGSRVRQPEWQSHRPQKPWIKRGSEIHLEISSTCSLIFSVPTAQLPSSYHNARLPLQPSSFFASSCLLALVQGFCHPGSPSTPSIHRSACMAHLTCTLPSYLRNLTFPAYVPLPWTQFDRA